MKIIIFGAAGFLGQRLLRDFSFGHEVIGYDRVGEGDIRKIDALNKEEVLEEISKEKPELVIDCIALRSSLECERNPELASKMNYETAKNILEAAKKSNSWVIFISSSYVFDGEKESYLEEDEVRPLNVYGRTKVLAEKDFLAYEKGIVIRVDLLYGYNGKGKNNGILSRILNEEDIEIGEPNQLRSPLLINDLGEIILGLIGKSQSGIFHVSGPTRIKIYDFFRQLESIVREESKIKVVGKKKELEFPHNSVLNISKIEKLGIQTTSVNEAIKVLKEQINSG